MLHTDRFLLSSTPLLTLKVLFEIPRGPQALTLSVSISLPSWDQLNHLYFLAQSYLGKVLGNLTQESSSLGLWYLTDGLFERSLNFMEISTKHKRAQNSVLV